MGGTWVYGSLSLVRTMESSLKLLPRRIWSCIKDGSCERFTPLMCRQVRCWLNFFKGNLADGWSGIYSYQRYLFLNIPATSPYLKITFFGKVLDIRSFIHVSTWMQSHLMVNDDEAEDDNIVWTWERKATLMVATQYRIEIFPSKGLLRLWEYLLHNQTIVSRYNLRIWILYHKYIFLCMIQKIKIKNLGIKKNTNPWLCLIEKNYNWVINISTS